jgi:hypothetical protein
MPWKAGVGGGVISGLLGVGPPRRLIVDLPS